MNIEQILMNVQQIRPTVHCITNIVTANDCANIVLAIGAAPTMAHDARETAEITAGCKALVLNLGNVEDTDAMLNAGRKSNQLAHPIILDPVGVGGSKLRRDTFEELAENMKFSVIRGNATEIRKLATGLGSAAGVDAAKEDAISSENADRFVQIARQLADRYNCVVSISGKIDIVVSKEKAFVIENGVAEMSKVTGTGCMSTALIGALCGANPDHILESVVAAVLIMGVSGEIAAEQTNAVNGGTMTFKMHLIDAVSQISAEEIRKRARYESV